MRIIKFLLLYVLVPVLVIFLTVRSGNWFGLFGLLFYLIGLAISGFSLWIFLPIPLGFAFWYWYTYGMGPTDYVFIYTLCLLAGVAMNEAGKQMSRFMQKVLPEQMTNIEYNEKVEELNRRLERYRLDHPDEKLTPEIVEKIRTDVFFD